MLSEITNILANGLVAAEGIGLIQTSTRAFVGGFFAISGFHKLFNADRRATMRQTLQEDGIPFPRFNTWFVAGNEFVMGLATIAGFLTVPAAAVLLVICVVACFADGVKKVASWKPIDLLDWVDDLLYLPETLYVLMAAFLILTGAGPLSVDAIIWR